ncbi:MAG TPA: MarR family transcriptional regulator [Propionibacteriaceae bacterium]|nr:MarR family transcriptional regulator [Propionibacteriaceae bacterium]
MEEDLSRLGEDLITTAARMVRWVQTDGLTLSLASARILARLSDRGSARISDLAAAERSSQPTITNHVKRLEAAGLVERAADPSDARAWIIRLTEQGHAELAAMRAALGNNVAPYLAPLSARDRAALRAGIEVMRQLMGVDRLPQ